MTEKNAGFSLLELIIVIVILGALTVTAVSRFANDDSYRLRIIQEDIISALTQAQQLAMAGQPVQFTAASGAPSLYSVRLGAPLADYSVAGVSFPQEVDAAISIAPLPLTINYDVIGRPDVTPTLVLTTTAGDSVSVCISATGLAYGC